MRTQTIKRFKIFFKTLLSIILVTYLIRSDKMSLELLLNINFHYTSVIYLLVILSLFSLFQMLRWHALIKTQRIHLPFMRCMSLYMVSQFFATFLPGSIGGDLVRSFYIIENSNTTKSKAVSTIIYDRIWGIYTFILIGSLAFCYLTSVNDLIPVSVNIIGYILFFLLCIASLLLFYLLSPASTIFLNGLIPQKLKNKIDFSALNENYRQNPKLLFYSFIFSVASSLLFIFSFYFIGAHLTDDIILSQSSFIVPLIVISNLIPLTPGGLGIGETTSDFLFQEFNINVGAEILILLRFWSLIIRLPGGILFIFLNLKR